MGVRGELFSTKVGLQNRTYFFNVKENRLGDLYLNIVESKNRDEGGFERQSVILFADDLQEFLKGFDESLRVLEKAVREKRRGKTVKADRDTPNPRFAEEREDYPPRDRESRPRSSTPARKSDGRSFRTGRDSGRNISSGRNTSSGRSSGRDSGRSSGPSRNTNSGRNYSDKRESGRSYDKSEGRRSYGDKDRKPEKDFAPRKKRVVVKKK